MNENTPPQPLTHDELARYGRQVLVPQVGIEGQQRLNAARVLIAGAGGLGSPAALYLAAAGVGRLGLVDDDQVSLDNLHRQLLYGTGDVGRRKCTTAVETLARVNPNVDVSVYDKRLSVDNARDILGKYDVILDCTDNFQTRFLINDACVLLEKPYVYGSVYQFEGQASVFATPDGPCYRCLHPEPPPPGSVPNCAESGILGIVPGLIGTVQATEAIKLILGQGESLAGRLLLYDALAMNFHSFPLAKNNDCTVCGAKPTITSLTYSAHVCAAPEKEADITVQELKQMLDQGQDVFLLDVRLPVEGTICTLPGGTMMPLAQLPQRLAELDPNTRTVVYCHIGIRSASAVALLRRAGFSSVRNLKGGIHAWAQEIDHGMPRY